MSTLQLERINSLEPKVCISSAPPCNCHFADNCVCDDSDNNEGIGLQFGDDHDIESQPHF